MQSDTSIYTPSGLIVYLNSLGLIRQAEESGTNVLGDAIRKFLRGSYKVDDVATHA